MHTIQKSLKSHVKDRPGKLKMCGVVYHIKCEQRTGNNIGEIARSLSTWIKQHQSCDTSAVLEHCRATGRNINPNNVKALSDENNTIKRRVKEAIRELRQRRRQRERQKSNCLTSPEVTVTKYRPRHQQASDPKNYW